MAENYTLRASNNPDVIRDTALINSAKTFSFNVSPWQENNNTVTSVTWTLKSGQAAITGAALAANVASALLTFGEAGRSKVQVKFTTTVETFVIYLDILVKDPNAGIVEDYGICR